MCAHVRTVFVDSLKSQNDMKIVENLSSASKRNMTKGMAEVQMMEMQRQLQACKNEKPGNISFESGGTTQSALTIKDDDNIVADGDNAEAEDKETPFLDQLSQFSQPKAPDGQIMCLSAQECKRAAGQHNDDHDDFTGNPV